MSRKSRNRLARIAALHLSLVCSGLLWQLAHAQDKVESFKHYLVALNRYYSYLQEVASSEYWTSEDGRTVPRMPMQIRYQVDDQIAGTPKDAALAKTAAAEIKRGIQRVLGLAGIGVCPDSDPDDGRCPSLHVMIGVTRRDPGQDDIYMPLFPVPSGAEELNLRGISETDIAGMEVHAGQLNYEMDCSGRIALTQARYPSRVAIYVTLLEGAPFKGGSADLATGVSLCVARALKIPALYVQDARHLDYVIRQDVRVMKAAAVYLQRVPKDRDPTIALVEALKAGIGE
jgi:hypothetical protein